MQTFQSMRFSKRQNARNCLWRSSKRWRVLISIQKKLGFVKDYKKEWPKYTAKNRWGNNSWLKKEQLLSKGWKCKKIWMLSKMSCMSGHLIRKRGSWAIDLKWLWVRQQLWMSWLWWFTKNILRSRYKTWRSVKSWRSTNSIRWIWLKSRYNLSYSVFYDEWSRHQRIIRTAFRK